MLFGRAILPLLRIPSRMLALHASLAERGEIVLPGDVLIREHSVRVPVDHANPQGRFGTLDVFVREIVPASKDGVTLPCLIYLQGGLATAARTVDAAARARP